MEKKMTKKEMFAQVIALAQGKEISVTAEEIVAFAEHEMGLLEKKSGKTGKTKTQKENEVLVEQVFDALAEVGKAVTVTEFQGVSEFAATFSNQKLSALLKKLVDAGRVAKAVEGKKSYFSIPTAEVEDTEEGEEVAEIESEEVEG